MSLISQIIADINASDELEDSQKAALRAIAQEAYSANQDEE